MMDSEIYIIVRYPPVFEVERKFTFDKDDWVKLCERLIKNNRCVCYYCLLKAVYTLQRNYPINYKWLRFTPSSHCYIYDHINRIYF